MTSAFTVATTIDHPVGPVWERLVDWDTADQWMSGVDALRAEGPTAAGTTLGLHGARQGAPGTHRSTETRAQYHAEVQPGRGYRRLCVRVCDSGPRHPREPGGRLLDDRSRATSRPGHQVRHS